jgi:hypothetical protein
MRSFAYLLVFSTLIFCGCNNTSSKSDKNQQSVVSPKVDLQDKDPQMTAFVQRRKELEKQGYY